MASELRVNTLKDAAGNNSVATSFVANGSAKAWCKFGPDAQPDDSFNIASGTDVAVGQYRFAKTNVMSTTNYAITASSGKAINAFTTGDNSNAIESTANHTQSKYDAAAASPGFVDYNADGYGMHTIHGDLA